MNLYPNKPDFRGNFFSQITFLWLEKLFFKGYREKLKESDLYDCPKEHQSKELYALFVKHWQVEIKKRKPDIKIPLAKTLRNTFLIAALFNLLETLLLLLQAILVSYFSSICKENPATDSIAATIAITLTISLIALYLPLNNVFGHYLLNSVGLQLKSICITAMFKKLLGLQQTTLHKASIGHIINLVSNDVYKLAFGTSYWNYIVIAPIIVAISTGIMLVYIGPIGLVGVLYLILHAPLLTGLAFLFGHFRYLQSVTTDKRIRIMDQIIRGMQVVKFYVWETPFVEYISRIRRKEVLYASLSGFTQSINFSFFSTSLFIALFLTYCVSVAYNEPINTAQLGLIFLVLNTLRLYGVFLFGEAVFSLRECVICLKRIQWILELPNNLESCITMKPCTPADCPAIYLNNFSASWGGIEVNSNKLVLKSIQLSLDSNHLVAIAGPVGSGKSSLLLSLINELPGLSGHLTVTGKLSYTSQEPWIFSGTIRDNILFGKPLDSERYWEVISACSLTEDIDAYTDRDMTLIGERGVTLSGGQKARVSLARSVYYTADIYLFDDPLSAVDARVGKELFENCMRTLLRNKMVILVTHHIHYVRQADCVVVMREGEIVYSGTYQEVVSRNEFCREFLQRLEESDKKIIGLAGNSISNNNEQTVPVKDTNGSSLPYTPQNKTIIKSELDITQPLFTALTTEDYRPNSISTFTYFRYFWAGGLMATIILLLLTVISNAALLLAYWWMQSIAKCSESTSINSTNGSNATVNNPIACPWYFRFNDLGAVWLLALFTFSGSIFMFLRGFNFYYVVLQASRRLHNKMLHRIVHTPIRFFDTNPSGRILNRFSKDIGFLDEQLPRFFYDFWQFSTYQLSIAIATCAVQVFMIIPFILVGIATLASRHLYLRTSTQIKRIESIARSPLYSHISLALQGLCTIRALRIEDRITQDFHYLQDNHSRAWYYYIACNRWFSLRLDFLASLLVVFSLIAALVARCVLGFEELIGFSIPLLLTIPVTFQYVVRMSGEVEVLMVSTDRILNYCNLPQERSYSSSSHKHNGSIISNASGSAIEYSNVCYNYSKELPYSLRDVTLRVLPGEKIGIIGRTGAGKSSLLNSLFLMNGVSAGSISIGGEDISGLNLYEHRKRLSIIPQDPFLFSGTLRYNLDPFEEFSCDELWSALEKSHLKSLVERLPNQLLTGVEEDGRNFSTGERQLLCLARALLRRNHIIVIDEATANVDMHTDLLVQQAIRTHFSNCTVLTIAHRIETVIDSDRIVVLDKGTIVEADIPFVLLSDEHSYLNRFITQLDPVAQTHLREMAQRSYYKQQ